MSAAVASAAGNGDDAASNWPAAFTAKVAPTGGSAPCSRSRRVVSIDPVGSLQIGGTERIGHVGEMLDRDIDRCGDRAGRDVSR